MRMLLRLLLCVVLAFSLVGCQTAHKKKEKEEQDKKKEAEMEDVWNDVSFQAYLGRLRKAVAAHDVQTVAEMMTTNFGYRLDPPAEGDGVFKYWDEEMLWPQLQAVLGQRFMPKDNFMVAPPEFATDPNFHGYRAGITQVDGSWKFAYFVTDAQIGNAPKTDAPQVNAQ